MATAEENIEMDNMNKDGDNDQAKEDNDETTALLNDQIKSTSTHSGGARPKTHRLPLHSYENPSFVLNEPLTAEEKLAAKAALARKEEDQKMAWDEIKKKFPEFKPDKSKFIAKIDEYNNVQVILTQKRSVWHNFLDVNGELNSKLPDTLKKNLGLQVETVIEKLVNKIQKWRGKNKEDKAQLDRVGISEGETREITERLETRDEAIAEGEREIEELEGRMKLKDRIKSIFKKHGFTITAVISAVGAIIGVIVSNLKTGLAKMAKGVGNGLKEIGKKLGALLPGMIGAIASFIFKNSRRGCRFPRQERMVVDNCCCNFCC